jgi:hypothetical protein
MDEFKFTGLLWRLVFSLALVLLTFNPSGFSYLHWLADGFPTIPPLKAVIGILLLAGWVFFVRSTLLALGTIGLILAMALFASIVWWMAHNGWLQLSNRTTMAWVVLCVLGLVLGIGMSWAHIQRRISGQAAVDEVER